MRTPTAPPPKSKPAAKSSSKGAAAQPSHTLIVRVTPERAPLVSRTLELLASQSLQTLHLALQKQFGLDGDLDYVFFPAANERQAKKAYEGPDGAAKQLTFVAADCQPGQTWTYIYDPEAALRHQIFVESQGQADPAVRYPRLLAAVGDAPVYEPLHDEVAEDLLELADATADACDAWCKRIDSHSDCDGCETEHVAFEPAELKKSFSLAQRLLVEFKQRPTQLPAFAAYCGNVLLDWVGDICFELAGAKRLPEAEELQRAYAALLPDEEGEPLGSHAMLLLRAGKMDEAKSEVAQRLLKRPDELNTLSEAATVYAECGELERAEKLCRRLWELVQTMPDDELKLMAGHQLLEVLEAAGKDDDAAELATTLDELELATASDDELDDELDDEVEAAPPTPPAKPNGGGATARRVH